MEEKKPNANGFNSLIRGAVDLGKKASADVKVGVAAMVEKAKADEYARRLKKYSPLFPAQFNSSSFNLPNIIVIVDDAVRRGIDVCEGSIGWLSKESGEEVLHLYDEAVPFSGIQFIPSAICNAVYYVDNYDRGRFIQTNCIFAKAHEEKIAELQHVADSLGAKRCTIDISESSMNSTSTKKSAGLSASEGNVNANASADQEFSTKNANKQRGHIEAEFRGLRFPKKPKLKWFAHDDSICQLVDMCCSGRRRVKKLILELSGTTTATMSQSTACTIDGIISKAAKVKGQISMSSQAKEEHKSTLYFHIEF